MSFKRFSIILFCIVTLIVNALYTMSIELYAMSFLLMTAAFLICIVSVMFSDYTDLRKFEERKQTSHRTYH